MLQLPPERKQVSTLPPQPLLRPAGQRLRLSPPLPLFWRSVNLIFVHVSSPLFAFQVMFSGSD